MKTSTGEKTADGKVAISKGIMPTAKPDMDMFMEKHIYNAGLLFTREKNSQFVIGVIEDFIDGTITEEFNEVMCLL